MYSGYTLLRYIQGVLKLKNDSGAKRLMYSGYTLLRYIQGVLKLKKRFRRQNVNVQRVYSSEIYTGSAKIKK